MAAMACGFPRKKSCVGRSSCTYAARALYFGHANWRRSQDMNPVPVEKLRGDKTF
jgi:hypothetical protein